MERGARERRAGPCRPPSASPTGCSSTARPRATTPSATRSAALEATVARLRRLRPPWHTGVSEEVGLPVPTLVVTGGWSPLYDQTAQALAALGAARLELSGAGHGAHRDPRGTAVLRDFWAHPCAGS